MIRRATFLAFVQSVGLVYALGLVGITPGAAQQLGTVQSPILTVESERLFTQSAFGTRIAQEVEAESAVLAAENRRIEAELMEEERLLTERRATMDPDAFRALADAFDEKVQEIRRTQDGKARTLAQRRDNDRVVFLQAIAPVLEQLMRDAGAAVILERGSVFLSLNATDITEQAIERIDQAIGDGAALRPE
ncbi:OmpH family outer membrane protein [Aestuariivita sp.]|jgi:Skp family chaperone for outer membrane proteins|uniref:OmpH family outer membrane protein n=1 Tax=Aestuariivita sp. TaxID=1872407 RepID=UPI00216F7213|nr:OmpH family outer membrane protein [Aestuariivita sp.]MCE8006470.1 OmpH family outer membrane protein [Aestuariivita sp.]